MAFIIKNGNATNRRTFEAYDGEPGKAAELYVTYTAGGGASTWPGYINGGSGWF